MVAAEAGRKKVGKTETGPSGLASAEDQAKALCHCGGRPQSRACTPPLTGLSPERREEGEYVQAGNTRDHGSRTWMKVWVKTYCSETHSEKCYLGQKGEVIQEHLSGQDLPRHSDLHFP